MNSIKPMKFEEWFKKKRKQSSKSSSADRADGSARQKQPCQPGKSDTSNQSRQPDQKRDTEVDDFNRIVRFLLIVLAAYLILMSVQIVPYLLGHNFP